MTIFGIDFFKKNNNIEFADTNAKSSTKRKASLSSQILAENIAKAEVELENLKTAITVAKDVDNPDRTLLLGIYDQILEEGHLSSQIRTAHFTIQQSDFEITVNGKEDEEKKKLFETGWFTDFIEHAVDSEFYGHSLIEFGQQDEGLFSNVTLINRYNVIPEFQKIKLNLDTQISKAIPYSDKKEEWFLLEIGKEKDLGLLKKAAVEVIWKNYARSDWSNATEKFGMPLLSINTDTSDDKELDALESMTQNFGSNGYLIGSKDTEINILQPDRGTQFYLNYERLADFCDKQISKLINGQVSTSDEKSYVGSAEVQERVLNTYTKGRLQRIQRVINDSLIPFLIKKAYPLEGVKFQYLDLKKKSNLVTTSDTGVDQKKKSELNQFLDLNDVYSSLKYDYNDVINFALSANIKLVFDKLVQNIHKLASSNSLKEDEIILLDESKNMILEYAKQFNSAIDEGFKLSGYLPDAVFDSRLRQSAYIFSGYKTNSMLKEITSLLKDEKGIIKPFNKFRDEVLSVDNKYNVNWLKTEYNQAISTSQQASRWKQYEESQDEFFLQYRTAGDERVRDSHYKLNKITLPMSDGFWDEHYPPNGWGCRCTSVQVLKSQYKETTKEEVDKNTKNFFTGPEKIFAYNPGKTTALFPPKHPYYNVSEGNDVIINISEQLYRDEIKMKLNSFRAGIDAYKGMEIKSNSLKTEKLIITRSSIKEISYHNSDIYVKSYILRLENDIENWKYLGWSKIDSGKHLESAYFFYYSTIINSVERYINVKIHKTFKAEVIYTILDSINKSKLTKGLPSDIEKYIKK